MIKVINNKNTELWSHPWFLSFKHVLNLFKKLVTSTFKETQIPLTILQYHQPPAVSPILFAEL